MMTSNEVLVKCPHCQKKFTYNKSEFRPFCSEKCKLIDLGSWLNESYAIAGELQEIKDDEDVE